MSGFRKTLMASPDHKERDGAECTLYHAAGMLGSSYSSASIIVATTDVVRSSECCAPYKLLNMWRLNEPALLFGIAVNDDAAAGPFVSMMPVPGTTTL